MTIIPLLGAVVPFFLLPIEGLLPYPHVVEELAKLGLVFFLYKKPVIQRLKLAAATGTLFAISETVLYSFNLAAVGDINTLLLRLALTIPLHAITTAILSLSPLFLPFSILIHWGLNSLLKVAGS